MSPNPNSCWANFYIPVICLLLCSHVRSSNLYLPVMHRVGGPIRALGEKKQVCRDYYIIMKYLPWHFRIYIFSLEPNNNLHMRVLDVNFKQHLSFPSIRLEMLENENCNTFKDKK
jgi:hypothetical protein